MSRPDFPPISRITNIILLVLVTVSTGAGCSNVVSSSELGTATARAQGVIRLATQMGSLAQSTLVAENEQATATAQAYAVLFDEAKNWQILISDSFNENQNGWATGDEQNPDYASMHWAIEAGKYRWEAKALNGFVWWVTPDREAVSDFFLSVETHQLDNPQAGEYGLVFRQSDESHYYLFEIDEQGEYAVFIYTPDGWEALIDWTNSPAIQPGETNQLAMIARGDEFSFFINALPVAGYHDARLSSGNVGLLVGLSNAGEEASWEFDEFQLRIPQ
jgi:hypothetical protein